MKIAIIGGGVAAFEAAKNIRSLSDEAEVTIYSREAVPPYRRPALSRMAAEELADPRVVALPIEGDEPFTFLYCLPVFQTVASTLSSDLDSLPSHPLYYEMNKVIDFRTEEFRAEHPAEED